MKAVLPTPIFDPSESSAASPDFQEPLTLVIGTFREDDLIESRVDGRRFEPGGDRGVPKHCRNMEFAIINRAIQIQRLERRSAISALKRMLISDSLRREARQAKGFGPIRRRCYSIE